MSDTALFTHEWDFVMDYSPRNEILPITAESWERIRQLIRENEIVAKNAGQSVEVTKRYRTVLLLDDAVSREMDHDFLDTLLSRARHVFVKVVISSQSVQASLRPLGRFNIGLLFLSSNISSETAAYTYPMSGSSARIGIPTKRKFIEFVERYSKPFHFIRFSPADPSVPPRLIESTGLKVSDTVVA